MSRYYEIKRLRKSGAHSVQKRIDHAESLREQAIELRKLRRHHWMPPVKDD